MAGAAVASPIASAQPYSFLVAPTDQLAVPGLAAATEVTPEGYLYTGWAEIVFRAGPSLRAWNQPVRTLEGGRYPVVRQAREIGGLGYSITAFAAPVGKRAVNFVRVRVRNRSARTRRGGFGLGARWSGGTVKPSGVYRFRFRRPATPSRRGLYFQPGEAFRADARHSFAGRALLREDKALYLLPARTPPGVRVVRRAGKRRGLRPGTVVGNTAYRFRLRRGRSLTLEFKVPVEPPTRPSADYAAVAKATYSAQHARKIGSARRVFRRMMEVQVPDPKVEDAFYANVGNILAARYQQDGYWIQTVNRLQYHAFWLRDGAVMTNVLDLVGLSAEARENLGFFPLWQEPSGQFISRPEQYDGHGQALWAMGEHVRRTRSEAYAKQILPAVGRAMGWLARVRREDPLGLLPAGTPGDNELTTGHMAGDNFWGVAGARAAADIARAAGDEQLAERWSAEAASYAASLDAAVRRASDRTGGWIPPALDAPGGQDWGNLWAFWPTAVYPAGDPIVEATMRRARGRFREGIATYLDGRLLHHYLGFRVFQTDLADNDQDRSLRGLYDTLAHTTSTHAGFETGVRVYGSRAVDDNMTPHGWFAAEYAAFVRNMLVREDGAGITLLSLVAPHWLAPGRTVAARRVPTLYGDVDVALRSTRDGAELRWDADVPEGTRLRFAVPDWVRDVDAEGLDRRRRWITLGGRSGALEIRWRRSDARESYGEAVQRLRSSYRRRGR